MQPPVLFPARVQAPTTAAGAPRSASAPKSASALPASTSAPEAEPKKTRRAAPARAALFLPTATDEELELERLFASREPLRPPAPASTDGA